MALSKAGLLKGPKVEEVKIPSLGDTVRIRSMTALEMFDVFEAMPEGVDLTGKMNEADTMEALRSGAMRGLMQVFHKVATICLVEEDGSQTLTEGEAASLAMDVVVPVALAAFRLSGVKGDMMEAARGN